jgi:uncharacterized protein (TIRG00374 family)
MRLGKNVKRRLIASIVFGLIVYVGLAIFGDVRSMGASLRAFRWEMLPLIFGLAFMNYVIRFVRWSYYLGVLEIRLPLRDSVTIFMSGLAMSITPGKLGEVVKSYFLKTMTGTPMHRSVPIVFAERLTDFVAIVALAALGAASFRHGETLLWIGAACTVAGLGVVLYRPLMVRIVDVVARLPFLNKPAETLHALYDHAYRLLRVRPLLIACFLGIAAWFCECVAFHVTVDAMGYTITLWQSTFIYAFATFFGALTFLPGGLGATEGSLTGLAILQGVPRDAASAITIIVRIATLWFAVALGLLWLAPNQRVLIPDREEMEGAPGV